MIPEFEDNGNLPPGIHETSWEEFIERFGRTPQRKRLLKGLRAAMESLRTAGCRRVYLDGSFVTAKDIPNDYDGCWDIDGVDVTLLDPILLRFEDGRAAQKAKYLGEFFPTEMTEHRSGVTFAEFFQIDKESGQSKGIILLNLERLQ
jgi:hypothetical protein